MSEESSVEIPAQRFLESLGYTYLPAAEVEAMREGPGSVLLREEVVEAVMRINGVPRETARSVYGELAGLRDNEKWFERLRGNYSKKVSGESTSRSIRLLDFDDLANNRWVVTRQLRVKGTRGMPRPDLVVYVNGIPLVVIEAKDLTRNVAEGIAQMRRYEAEAPALFYSNAFNIVTTGADFRYAATGSPRAYWFRWPEGGDFGPAEVMERGLWATLSPRRLLDIIAHFIVFERDEKSQKVVKKICRYQQYRAVNKMVDRVLEGRHKKGLIWHTQGSGKSLTMVFAALKLKFHQGIDHPALKNPNILVVTDRRDLDAQITSTFRACGLPNPKHAGSIEALRALLAQDSPGRTITSTIFKFDADDARLASPKARERQAAVEALAISGSDNWILLVDECHRTQEELLGAYLRATFPEAVFFGFTGTPVKKNDKDTYANFGAPGEAYLDKYGIDEAVRDRATVEVRYTARLPRWHLEEDALDAAFEREFADAPEEVRRKLKERGVQRADLARLESRIREIAADIWEHYRAHVMPDGYKAQVVAIDRKAVAAYKIALDEVIADWYVRREGLSPAEAAARAGSMSAAIYSAAQNDRGTEGYEDVVRFQLTEAEERAAIKRFRDETSELKILIVCDKLLTGFDAPIEQVMYLDKPLKDHNLLQAIARTNRRYEGKPYGLIVDYYGVSKNLQEALSAYRSEDVRGAMRPAEELVAALADAHREVMAMIDEDARHDARAAVASLGGLDRYYDFRGRAKHFVDLYAALMPDPAVIVYEPEVKLVATMIPVGKQIYEQEEGDLSFGEYSAKIRAMLEEHVEVTGIKAMCTLRSLDDRMFWADFDAGQPRDLETAAVRKTAELKKIVSERLAENEERYARFSERLRELIASFQLGLFDDAQKMEALEALARDVDAEDRAHQGSRLDERTYGVWAILKKCVDGEEVYDAAMAEATAAAAVAVDLEALAERIAAVYESDDHAPVRWQDKPQVCKNLRSQVRHILLEAGVKGWKTIPERVEKFAREHYAKS